MLVNLDQKQRHPQQTAAEDISVLQAVFTAEDDFFFVPIEPPPLHSCSSCPLAVDLAMLRAEKGYYRAMHQKALDREASLHKEIEELKAKLRLRERQLFGRKSEKGDAKQETQPSDPNSPKRPRGQQPGSQGHGRRDYSHLPAETELIDIPQDQRVCPCCGLPFEEFPKTETSEILEVDVRPYRRVIKRKCYTPTCTCDCNPGIITAPAPAKVIPKAIYGISVWTTVLLDKFLFLRPTHRLLAELKTHEMGLAQGTVTDGLKALAPLFSPVYQAILEKNRSEDRWHADETRWLVFCVVEGKVGYKWYMWTYLSKSTVAYVLDPTRSSKVPCAHFHGVTKGILVVDRYSAYKAMAKLTKITLAFCWAHVRRDFLGVAKDWPKFESWAMDWVSDIGTLYHLNHQRLKALDEPTVFAQRDDELRKAIETMDQKRAAQFQEKELDPAKKKVLKSLKEHWQGLTVFIDHPEVPMDNNKAENSERTPVIGRNNFYGSFSVWSGTLAAMMFSIFKTLELWKLNPRLWLTAYLAACAENQGKVPDDFQRFLPWNMTADQLKAFGAKPDAMNSS